MGHKPRPLLIVFPSHCWLLYAIDEGENLRAEVRVKKNPASLPVSLTEFLSPDWSVFNYVLPFVAHDVSLIHTRPLHQAGTSPRGLLQWSCEYSVPNHSMQLSNTIKKAFGFQE